MGYGANGAPTERAAADDSSIRQAFKMELYYWISRLNSKQYMETTFFVDVQKYTESGVEWDYLKDHEVLTRRKQERNLFITWELKAIGQLKRWIDAVHEYYEILDYEGNENEDEEEMLVRFYEIDNIEKVHLLKELHEEEVDVLLFSKIEDVYSDFRSIDIWYFLLQMRIDLSKITNFLENQYDLSVPEVRTFGTDHNGKTFETVFQAVLYHNALQDANLEPRFVNVRSEIKEVVQRYYLPTGKNISHNTFYQKHCQVLNKEGYRDRDFWTVRSILAEDHPEAMKKFEENYFKQSFF